MFIQFDTEQLSPGDKRMLRALLGEDNTGSATVQADRAAERPTRTRKAAEPKAAPEPTKDPVDEAPAEPDAPAAEPEDDGSGVSLDDAVTRATELVQAGKSAAVKAALKEVGAKRVSELEPALIADFLAALEAA